MHFRYEGYRGRLDALQERVPDHPPSDYEPAVVALQNALIHEGRRRFGWLRAATWQLRIAEQALAEIDGVGRQLEHAPVRLVTWPVVRWVSAAVVGSALGVTVFLVGMQPRPAPPPARPSHAVVNNWASNQNATSGNVTVSNEPGGECGVNEYCGYAANGPGSVNNSSNVVRGDANVTVNNNP